MAEGIVIAWSDPKGYGVIGGDDGAEVFVHSTDIESAGLKTLTEGQRVTYDVEQTDQGSRARKVVPSSTIEVHVSPDEWTLLEPFCKEQKIEARYAPYVDSWNRSFGRLTIDIARKKDVDKYLSAVKPQIKAARPANPVYIVHLSIGETGHEVVCAVGAAKVEEAEELAVSRIPLPDLAKVIDGAHHDLSVQETASLDEYEEETQGLLPSHSYPLPGQVRIVQVY